MSSSCSNKKHIILAGGGHTNVLALLRLAGRCRLTLVSEEKLTPYSGMIPGYIAGYYRRDRCFINLQETAAKHGTEFILGRIANIENSTLLLADGRTFGFDALSLNTGATPAIPFTAAGGCAVKPIAAFIQWLDSWSDDNSNDTVVAVVGGGGGGVETALALAQRWRRRQTKIILAAEVFMPSFPPRMRDILRRTLAMQNIDVVESAVTDWQNGILSLKSGASVSADRVIFATGVTAPTWLKQTPLTLSNDGFVCVNDNLQSTALPRVFATGDVATHVNATATIPKSGVMAVRQAPVLAHNLLAAAGGGASNLRQWRASAQALSIIGIGNERAVACRNGVTVSGGWVWRWKRYLDERFVDLFG